MKRFYIKHLAISENERISDDVFKNRIALSLISILFCLTVMISSAFAFFNCNLKNDFTVRAAKWEIIVEDAEDRAVQSVRTSKSYEEGEIYKFKILADGTAEKGYCKITIDHNDEISTYYTESFDDEIDINIQAVAGCTISFSPRWGNPVSYGITKVIRDGDTIEHSHTEVQLTDEGSAEGDGSSDAADTYSESQNESGETQSENSGNSPSSEADVSLVTETTVKNSSSTAESNNESSGSSEGTSSVSGDSGAVSNEVASLSESTSSSNDSSSSASANSSSSDESTSLQSDSRSSSVGTASQTTVSTSAQTPSSATTSSSEGTSASQSGDTTAPSNAGGEE